MERAKALTQETLLNLVERGLHFGNLRLFLTFDSMLIYKKKKEKFQFFLLQGENETSVHQVSKCRLRKVEFQLHLYL